MNLISYFAGFTLCTDSELSVARFLQIIVNIAAFIVIFFAVKKMLKIEKSLVRLILVIIAPIFIYAAFVIIYVTLAIPVVGLCNGSPGLWDF